MKKHAQLFSQSCFKNVSLMNIWEYVLIIINMAFDIFQPYRIFNFYLALVVKNLQFIACNCIYISELKLIVINRGMFQLYGNY